MEQEYARCRLDTCGTEAGEGRKSTAALEAIDEEGFLPLRHLQDEEEDEDDSEARSEGRLRQLKIRLRPESESDRAKLIQIPSEPSPLVKRLS